MANLELEIRALTDVVRNLGGRGKWKSKQLRLPDTSSAQSVGDQQRLRLARRLVTGMVGKEEFSTGPLALRSVFDLINTADSSSDSANFLQVRSLSVLNETIFPIEQRKTTTDQKYDQLLKGLVKQIGNLEPLYRDNAEAYLEGIYLALMRYAALIPAADTRQDVSIFDEARITAAVVSALRSVSDDEIRRLNDLNNEQLLAANSLEFSLVAGDISGVQDYIYGFQKAEGAARRLRGRSFYLQMVTEAAMRFVLQSFDLPITSAIYSGGAKFYLLTPSIDPEKLDAARRVLLKTFLRAHGMQLYLALAHTRVATRDFSPGRMSHCWADLHRTLAEVKNSRYAALLPEEFYQYAFAPHEPAEEPQDVSKLPDWQLGSDIANASHLLIGLGEPNDSGATLTEQLGVQIGLIGPNKPSPDHEFTGCRYILKLELNELSDRPSRTYTSAMACVEGVRYCANRVPENTFDELAKLPSSQGEQRGIHRLGILRMDVDNLGRIFSAGLGKSATLTRIAGLSRIMSVYFEGRVPVIAQQIEKEYFDTSEGSGGAVYSVYAGGDDAFFVGSWHLMPRLAQRISDEFSKLTGYNPSLHLSAGLSLVTAKHPLYQAAEDAHNALEAAKSVNGKNAFNFLGQSYKWMSDGSQHDFSLVQEWYMKFVTTSGLPIGFLGRLMVLDAARRHTVHRKPHGSASADAGPWIWNGVYQLHRLVEQYRKNAQDDVAEVMSDTLVSLRRDNFKNLEMLAFAARWAHLTLRKSST